MSPSHAPWSAYLRTSWCRRRRAVVIEDDYEVSSGLPIARGREAGVGIGALGPYYAKSPAMRGLLFGYGNLDERAIDEGLERFRASIASSFRPRDRQEPV
jgi:hypothetical protein